MELVLRARRGKKTEVLAFLAWMVFCTGIPAQEFAIAKPGYDFQFPRDHGAHPDYRIEWWYITGHLYEEKAKNTKERFGFQATWFRVGQQAGRANPATRLFGTNEFHMAHMALYQDKGKRFHHEERLNRGGWDAQATVGKLDIANGNWTLAMVDHDSEKMRLNATVKGEAAFTLELTPAKPHVIFGENGVSRKGADPSAASLYITFPRLNASGTLRLGDRVLKVSGQAWMDHEISSSQLDRNQVGWDWASIQFEPESPGAKTRELMIYILRDKSGKPDPYSKLVWIEEDGSLTHLGPDQFTWTPGRHWTSPDTGGRYPIDITIKTADPEGNPFTCRLRPLADHTEVVGHLGGVHYWEGPCDVLDGKNRVIGKSFVELTGYAQSLTPVLQAEE